MPVTTSDLEYYIDEKGHLKPLDHFQVLHLDRTFFQADSYSEDDFKKIARALYLQFHPDKNATHEQLAQITEIFKRIQGAIEILRDPKQREEYLSGRTASVKTTFASTDFADQMSWFDEKVIKLSALEARLRCVVDYRALLEDRATPHSASILSLAPKVDGEEDSFQKIANEFKSEYRSTMLTEELSDAQSRLYNLMYTKAKTAEDFYSLYQLASADHILSTVGHDLKHLQKAASLGHLLAMRKVAGFALTGAFTPRDTSVKWALECIRYLDKELSLGHVDSKIVTELQDGIERAKQRLGSCVGKKIPENSSIEYTNLVRELSNNSTGGGFFSVSFELSLDCFSSEDMGNIAGPVTEAGAERVSFEREIARREEQIAKITAFNEQLDIQLSALATNIDQIIGKNYPKAKKVAINLHNVLLKAKESFLIDLNDPTFNPKSAELFLSTCRQAILQARPILQRDLGWGDYMNNLFKSCVNAVAQLFGQPAPYVIVESKSVNVFNNAHTLFQTTVNQFTKAPQEIGNEQHKDSPEPKV